MTSFYLKYQEFRTGELNRSNVDEALEWFEGKLQDVEPIVEVRLCALCSRAYVFLYTRTHAHTGTCIHRKPTHAPWHAAEGRIGWAQARGHSRAPGLGL